MIVDAGRVVGRAVADLCNMLNPDLVIVGGDLSAAGDLLLDPARAELRRRALAPSNATPVVPAELGPDAGMIGAALLVGEYA